MFKRVLALLSNRIRREEYMETVNKARSLLEIIQD